MSWFTRFLNAVRPAPLERDIRREMTFHIREHADELRAQGLSEDDALREARRRFGNATYQGERTRDADLLTWLDSFRGDLRYAGRNLRRSPAFAFVAIASLALGIGANTAIYTLIDAVVLRGLPVPRPDELVQITMDSSADAAYFTNPLWEQVRDRQTGLTAIAAFGEARFNLAPSGETRHVSGSWVSGDYFKLFEVRPAVGRLLSRADDVRGCRGVAVLGHGFWEREYGADANIVGKTISLDRHPFEIVGVVAGGFEGPEVGSGNQIYVPLCAEAIIRGAESSLDRRSSWWMRVMGRRNPAQTVEHVNAMLGAIAPAAFGATVPQHWGATQQKEYVKRKLGAADARTGMSSVRERYTKALAVLMGAVALVLLIACLNVANLLLARAAARQREVAIRLAIGAARRRLIRQLLTESALLSFLGAAAGLVVARWSSRALVALISTSGDPLVLDLSMSWRVLGFTIGAALLTVFAFGVIPAWRGTRIDPQLAMKAHARGLAEGHGRFTIGKLLVVGQIALSLILLVGAGLLVTSLRNLTRLDPGFRSDGVLIAEVDLRNANVAESGQSAAWNELAERLRGIPGVQDIALASLTPLGHSRWNELLVVDGFKPVKPQDAAPWFNEVGAGYFKTMGSRIIAGRDFDETDRPGSARVAIVNDAMARRFWGSPAVLGKQFRIQSGDKLGEPYTVVGVVENSKYASLREEPPPTVFVAMSQDAKPGPYMSIVLRAEGEPSGLAGSVKTAIAQARPGSSLEMTSLSNQIAGTLRRERLLAVISTLFGAVGLLLSMLGLYGVMTYTVARRRNEIGVRIALGAQSGRVLRMVLGDVARVIVVGVLVGTAGALASGKLVASFLYGIEPGEPAIFAVAAVVLGVVAFVAGFGPALRASRQDPIQALRED